MLSTHKRSFPSFLSEIDVENVGAGEDVRMETCTPYVKRTRQSSLTDSPSSAATRKRPLDKYNAEDAFFTQTDVDLAREEGRSQVVQRLRATLNANEALKQAFHEVVNERDKLANDNRVLKAGVNTLNAKKEQIARELEHTMAQLREHCERYRALEAAVIAMHASNSMGGCRRDDQSNNDGFGGDVY